MSTERKFVKIINEICQKHKIPIASFCNNWIFELLIDSKTKYIVGYEFPHDNSSKKICDDKSALSEILTFHKIPNISHVFFMQPSSPYNDDKQWKKRVIDVFSCFHNDVVIKPNCGTSGTDVYHITNANDLFKHLEMIFNKGTNIAICPYVDIQKEYRVIVYKNKPQVIFEKKRKLSWKHNLTNGAIPIVVNDKKIKSKLASLALKATQLLNIKFCSVDVIYTNHEFKILEINAGVMLDRFATFSNQNYKVAKKIYEDVILDLLN